MNTHLKQFIEQAKIDFHSLSKPQANDEDWRFSPTEMWKDLSSLSEFKKKSSLKLLAHTSQNFSSLITADGIDWEITHQEGITASLLETLPDVAQSFIVQKISSQDWSTPLSFLALSDSYLNQSLVVKVSQSHSLDQPILIDLTHKHPEYISPPLIIFFEENSSCRLLLKTNNQNISLENIRIFCEKNSLSYIDVYEKTPHTFGFFELISLQEKASLFHTFLSLGGHLKRRDTTLYMQGKEAQCEARSAYLGRNTDYKEMVIRQKHSAQQTVSLVLEKGVASQKAYNVLNGIIQVEPNASGSEAYLTNRNLLLNDGVRSHSIPRLEIAENDVKCSHSSTTSLIDPSMIFYLATRGICDRQAYRILTQSFLEESLSKSHNLLIEELETVFLE